MNEPTIQRTLAIIGAIVWTVTVGLLVILVLFNLYELIAG